MCIGKEINNIADYFHYSEEGIQFFSDEERYSAYYISMYLIEDTHRAILAHREKGFSENPFIAYIEFWGVMQAIYIQQDSISELYYSVTGDKHSVEKLKKLEKNKAITKCLRWSFFTKRYTQRKTINSYFYG